MSIMSLRGDYLVHCDHRMVTKFPEHDTQTATWRQQDSQAHETSQKTSQQRQEIRGIDESDGQDDKWDFHTYDAESIHLSFDKRIQNLKVSLKKHQQHIDSADVPDDSPLKIWCAKEFLHRGMEAISQDILQLWSNEDTKLCNVDELRSITQEALEMFSDAERHFHY